jgi:hypothetical protein
MRSLIITKDVIYSEAAKNPNSMSWGEKLSCRACLD